MSLRAAAPYLTLVLGCALAASAVGDYLSGPRWGWAFFNTAGAVCAVIGFFLQIRHNRRRPEGPAGPSPARRR